MPREYRSTAAKCPHYRMEDSANGVKIWCEGAGDVAVLRLLFRDGQKARRWKETYCHSKDNYKKCPCARMHKLNKEG